ncbi:MOSC domain-containing protein [Martelella alba]|uniref:MOSC domain-containing protein n=1 Tax=Martelella alba TaxID=2590451 RepID=A0A506UJD3_9HYPH|nr:MOSC domain-containing protein [Martelella alba]TPW33437.1 MOSC domain-containing protein [Martelella alba]
MKIAALNIYPMKSARGIGVSRAACGPMGLDGDRRALLIEPDGRFITQRELPALARLSVAPFAGGLALSMAEKGSLVAKPGPERMDVTVWKDTLSAALSDHATDAILSKWFERPVRLAFFDAHSTRIASRDWVNSDTPVSFADGYQILVTSTGSLAALNDDLAAHGEATVGMERFRPNIVVDCDEAFAEDGWTGLTIGDVVLDFVKPCARCIMTTQDQTTGSREIASPMPAMGRLRMSADRRVPGPLFGWNAVPRTSGLLSVGDEAIVTGMRDVVWEFKKRS